MRPLLIAAVIFAALALAATTQAAGETVRLSLSSDGGRLLSGSGSASQPSPMNSDGTVIAFESLAAAVSGDSNGTSDIYSRDPETGTTKLLSHTPEGVSGNGASIYPALSGDAAVLAFQSLADDLVDGDGNSVSDVYVRNRQGEITRVSVAPDGGDADGASTSPAISKDGSTVAFCSSATNLVDGDDNGAADVFVADLGSETIERIPPPVTEPNSGVGCARVALSGDGSSVVFSYIAGTRESANAARVYIHHRGDGSTESITGGAVSSGMFGLSISDDGTRLAFESASEDLVDDDSNGVADVFIWDGPTGETARVSAVAGQEANAESGVQGIAMSGDGRWVVFSSSADNLVAGDTNGCADVFRFDSENGEITIASVDVNDRSANGPSYAPAVSEDGNDVTFTSLANNIVLGDRNKQPDVFLRTGDFPASAGTGRPPVTSPPAGIPDRAVTGSSDGDLPSWGMIIALGGLLIGVSVGAYLLLGRRPAA